MLGAAVVSAAAGAAAASLSGLSKAPSPDASTANVEGYLQSSLADATFVYGYDGDSYAGLEAGLGPSPSPGYTSLPSFVPGGVTSKQPSVISVRWGTVAAGSRIYGQVVELVGRSSPNHGCLGVLDVRAPLEQPWFAGYPQTSRPGTYFFVAQAGDACNADGAAPPAPDRGGASYLLAGRFPSSLPANPGSGEGGAAR